MPHPRIRPAALAVLGVLTAFATGAPAQASVTCDRVASPTGSDSAAGTESAPWRTISKLTSSVPAGATGCLRAGTYGGGEPRLHNPDVELTSFPGEQATVTAMIEVFPAAARAHIHHLRLDATNTDSTASLKVQADDTVVSDNDITKGGNGICVQVATFNPAKRVIIERNRIHNCGPADSKYDHQLYLQSSRDAIVRHNVMTGNKGGWGVHLYSDADGTLVEHNIIDGNRGGVVFAGDGTKTSDRNEVRNNVVTNSGPRWNIESSWSGGARGTGNSAHHNCLYTTGPDGPDGLQGAGDGFTASSNTVVTANPYVNRAAGNLRLAPGSPCKAIADDVVAMLEGDLPDPQPAPAPDPDPQPAPAAKPPATKPASRPVAPASRPKPAKPRGSKVRPRRRVFLSVATVSRRRVRIATRLRLAGHVDASPSRRRVRIQMKTRWGRWRTLLVTRTRGSSLRATLRMSSAIRRGAKLRAVVPGIGISEAIRARG